MNFDVSFATNEVRVTLTESLVLPEGQLPCLGSPGEPGAFDLLPQIESLVRQFLDGFVGDRHESKKPDLCSGRLICR